MLRGESMTNNACVKIHILLDFASILRFLIFRFSSTSTKFLDCVDFHFKHLSFHSPDFKTAFGSHGVNFELWLEMDGYSIQSLLKDPRFPNTPDIRTLSHSFREPPNLGESYASRMYAWFAPPETGNYQFLIGMCKWLAPTVNNVLKSSLYS